MKSLIIILGFMANGDVVTTSQDFPVVCPSEQDMQQAAKEIAEENKSLVGVTVACTMLDGKSHSFTVGSGPLGEDA